MIFKILMFANFVEYVYRIITSVNRVHDRCVSVKAVNVNINVNVNANDKQILMYLSIQMLMYITYSV